MYLLSVLLGLLFAWTLLAFIGPKKCVSTFTQAPVQGLPIGEIDSAMEAVGLAPSGWKGKAAAPSPAPAPAPVAEPSVADVAMKEAPHGPATGAPEPTAPSPAPAPAAAL